MTSSTHSAGTIKNSTLACTRGSDQTSHYLSCEGETTTGDGLMVLRRIFYGVTPILSGCSRTAPYENCCISNTTADCIFEYSEYLIERAMYCSASTLCEFAGRRIDSALGHCSQTEYPSLTSYSFIEFECLDTNNTYNIVSNFTVERKEGVNLDSNKVFNDLDVSSSEFQCIVVTECGSQVVFQALDVRLEYLNETHCTDELYFQDAKNPGLTGSTTCDDGGFIHDVVLFTSDSNTAMITMNVVDSHTGVVFVRAESSQSGALVNVTCGSGVSEILNNLQECPNVTTTTSLTTTTTTISTTTAATTTTIFSGVDTTAFRPETTSTDNTSATSYPTTITSPTTTTPVILNSTLACTRGSDQTPHYLSCAGETATGDGLMVLKRIFYGVTPTSSGCSRTAPYENCCISDTTADCIFEYSEFLIERAMYCSATTVCEFAGRRIDSALGNCDQTKYPSLTSYSFIEFECLDTENTYNIVTNFTVEGKEVVNLDSNKVFNDQDVSSSEFQCIVVTDCGSQVVFTALDVRLAYFNETHCTEELYFQDAKNPGLTGSTTCDDGGFIHDVVLFTSDSNAAMFTMNVVDSHTGVVFVRAESSQSGALVNVTCGSGIHEILDNLLECPTTTSPTTTIGTVEETTTTTTTPMTTTAGTASSSTISMSSDTAKTSLETTNIATSSTMKDTTTTITTSAGTESSTTISTSSDATLSSPETTNRATSSTTEDTTTILTSAATSSSTTISVSSDTTKTSPETTNRTTSSTIEDTTTVRLVTTSMDSTSTTAYPTTTITSPTTTPPVILNSTLACTRGSDQTPHSLSCEGKTATGDGLMVLKRIFYGVTPISSGCSRTAPYENCCISDTTKDCIFEYSEFLIERAMYCSATTVCEFAGRRIDSALGNCDQTKYPSLTSYSFIEFECLDTENTYDIVTNFTVEGKEVVNLDSNKFYVNQDIFSSEFQCIVVTECGSQVVFQALDVRLAYLNETHCTEELYFQDAKNPGPTGSTTCDDGGFIHDVVLFTSDSNAATFTMNVVDSHTGVVFVRADSSQSGVFVNVTCGFGVNEILDNLQECPNVTTTTSATTISTTTTTTTAGAATTTVRPEITSTTAYPTTTTITTTTTTTSTSPPVILNSTLACTRGSDQTPHSLSCEGKTATGDGLMVLKRIFYGVTPIYRGCNRTAPYESCCISDTTTDCIFEYPMYLNERAMYCSATTVCEFAGRRIDSALGNCDHTKYPSLTSYSFIEFECLDTENTYNIVTNFTVEGKEVVNLDSNKFYINQDVSSSEFQCIVVTECGSQVIFTALDVRLGYFNETHCTEELYFQDAKNPGLTGSTTCDDGGFIHDVVLFTSDSNAVMFTMNVLEDHTGVVFVRTESSQSGALVNVSCGSDVSEVLSNLKECPNDITTTLPTTTAGAVTTSTTSSGVNTTSLRTGTTTDRVSTISESTMTTPTISSSDTTQISPETTKAATSSKTTSTATTVGTASTTTISSSSDTTKTMPETTYSDTARSSTITGAITTTTPTRASTASTTTISSSFGTTKENTGTTMIDKSSTLTDSTTTYSTTTSSGSDTTKTNPETTSKSSTSTGPTMTTTIATTTGTASTPTSSSSSSTNTGSTETTMTDKSSTIIGSATSRSTTTSSGSDTTHSTPETTSKSSTTPSSTSSSSTTTSSGSDTTKTNPESTSKSSTTSSTVTITATISPSVDTTTASRRTTNVDERSTITYGTSTSQIPTGVSSHNTSTQPTPTGTITSNPLETTSTNGQTVTTNTDRTTSSPTNTTGSGIGGGDNNNKGDNDDSFEVGYIAAIFIGAALLAMLIWLAVVCIRKRREKPQDSSPADSLHNEDTDAILPASKQPVVAVNPGYEIIPIPPEEQPVSQNGEGPSIQEENGPWNRLKPEEEVPVPPNMRAGSSTQGTIRSIGTTGTLGSVRFHPYDNVDFRGGSERHQYAYHQPFTTGSKNGVKIYIP